MTNKAAFLTLSFGSTFTETRLKDIGGIEQALQQAFPHYDHYQAFTSAIVRQQLAKENILINDPETALQNLAAAGYRQVLIQPTHLLHGEEFEQKILTLQQHFTGSFDSLLISTPLIAQDKDYALTAAAITTQFPSLADNEAIVLMGHGSPRHNNKSFGYTYTRLQQIFDNLQLPVLVGTVEEADSPNLDAVLQRLQQNNYQKVHLYPLMVVAGDHAINDMYGNEPDSWKNQIENLGIATEGHLYGLGRSKAIQALYIGHALETLSHNNIK